MSLNHRLPRPTCAHRGRVLGSLFLVGALVAGCTSSGSDGSSGTPTLREILAASKAAGPAILRGTGVGGAKIRGAYDHSRRSSDLIFPLEFKGKRVNGGLRIIGDAGYIHREAVAPEQIAGAGPDTIFQRVATAAPWLEGKRRSSYLVSLLGPTDPLIALRSVASRSTLRRTGTGRVGGTEVVKYRVEGARPSVRGVTPFAIPGGRDLAVWVDGQRRLRRWAVTTRGSSVFVDVEYRPIPRIKAPPVSAIVQVTAPVLPAPSGSWAQVATGRSGGTNWSVERAPGTLGTQCWRLVTTPPVTPTGVDVVDGGRCVGGPEADQTANEYFTVPFATSSGAVEAILALVPPNSISNATVAFPGSTTSPATVIPNLGAIVYVGPPDPPVALFSVTTSDGIYDCGPGPILDLGDVAASSPQSVRDLRSSWAWACAPRFDG